jgi:methane monooxygenase component A alpha chain/propane monooxygenase large subunit
MPPSLIEQHEKAKSYDWEFTVGDPRPKFATSYTIPAKGKDPFRMLVREYLKMESEKDDRTHGFLDGALRMNIAENLEPRFNECLKLTLSGLTNAEFQAVSACGGIIAAVQNQELRQGYQAQMLDEMRHTQLEMALREYYVRHAPDPAGWDIAQRAIHQHPGGLIAIGEFQHFNTGDPIDCVVDLNVVVETAFTNILLVAVPQTAVVNGDHALATTFLSIQSDEARHMANGYGTLLAVLSDPANVPKVNASIERHFWRAHRSLDALVGWQAEYGARQRPWAFKDQWQEWVVDDFVGSYVERLTQFGITPPKRLAQAARDLDWMQHTVGLVLAAIWPLNFWRSDAMDARDAEWFEAHYPGWHAAYGGLWDAYGKLADPAGGRILLQELPALPPFCQVCQLPCVLPRLDENESRMVDVDGRGFAVCSEGCEWILKTWPTAYTGRKQFWARYNGWDLADVILDLGYVRPDGKTLMGQPLVNQERLWTIDDIRMLRYEVKDPLQKK